MKAVVLALLLGLAACAPKPKAPAAAAADPPTVAVAKGVVEAQGGLLRVLAPRDGVILGPLPDEGAQIAVGQVLARLDDREPRLQLDAAAAELGERRAQVEVAAARAAGAAREARRLAALAAADAATRLDADQAATAAAVATGELRQASGALAAAEARHRLAAYDVEVRTIRSPVAGRILRRTASPGAYVASAAPLFVLEPDGPRVVRAELDEAFADRVTSKSRAVVTKEFQPGRAYGAEVVRISDALTGPALPEEAASRADARVANVLLRLSPGADLRLGQRVLVRFTP